jgi:hypothetical protein
LFDADPTCLLVIRYRDAALRIDCEAVGLTGPFGFDGDFLAYVDAQYPTIGNVNDVEISWRVAYWSLEEDVLERPSKAASPFGFTILASAQ